jgi:RNA polymerase sigma factor (sigma-70 family)
VFRIGVNLALNHLRDNARFVDDQDALPDEPAANLGAEAQIEAREDVAALRQAITQLPTKQRMTLELRIYEDLPFRDIALELETPEQAADLEAQSEPEERPDGE